MTIALYGSIWLALLCFVIGEAGKRQHRLTQVPERWTIAVWGMGAALACAHTLLALHVTYHWDHARAVVVTAERAATVYGIAWQGSLFVNYAFLGWWLAECLWWWRAPQSYIRRPAVIEWLWRAVAFTILANGAVVFASPAGRLAGAPLILALAFIWWQDRHSPR